MSSAKARKRGRTRAQRYTSNVFSMFSEAKIKEFKEAFATIDLNKDGLIDHNDLDEMLTSLGKDPTDAYIDEMIKQAPGPINFTMFLTLFGEKMNGSDPEDVILSAFKCFDPEGKGVVDEEFIRQAMMTMGDRWSEDQVEDLFRGAPMAQGLLDYQSFTKVLTGSDIREDEN